MPRRTDFHAVRRSILEAVRAAGTTGLRPEDAAPGNADAGAAIASLIEERAIGALRDGRLILRSPIPETLPLPSATTSFTHIPAGEFDIEPLLAAYGLPTAFPPSVLAAAERWSGPTDGADLSAREDFRSGEVVTVDPDDARDFDDAIEARPTAAGWRLAVHIADVSHFVRPGDALDREARKRGNSTYLPDRVIPMLPERLSNDFCSLRPREDRLVVSAIMDFAHDGAPLSVRFTRGVIRSIARLTYAEAFEMLEGRGVGPAADAIRRAGKLARILRARRLAAGSLDLDFPEIKVRCDERGVPVAVETIAHDASHQLIEECMLAANEAVARALRQRNAPAIYRIHENPDPDKLAEFRALAAAQGFRVGDLTRREELVKLLSRIRGTPVEVSLKTALLRRLKRARYFGEPWGHYGLAKTDYCHFTSPIRRYADLVVHRAAVAVLCLRPKRGPRPRLPDSRGLAALAEHISTTERTSADAERDARDLKLWEWLSLQMERRELDAMDGLIVDVYPTGLGIEVPGTGLSGRLHIAELSDDFYLYDPARACLVGRRSRRTFKPGMRIPVFPARLDRARKRIEWTTA